MRISKIFTIFATIALTPLASFATDIPTTTNVNATVTFSSGSNSTPITFTGGTKKTVTLLWLTTTSNINIGVISNDIDYLDTNFSTQIVVNNSSYPAWNSSTSYLANDTVSYAGKDWVCLWWSQGDTPGATGTTPWKEVSGGSVFELTITLTHRPYPVDTAYIPVFANKDFTLTATPISLIEGDLPSLPFVFNIPAKTIYEVSIPVKTSGVSPVISNFKSIKTGININKSPGKVALSVPNSFHNGSVNVVSLNGRKIATMNLTSPVKNSLSIWNVSAGMYVLHIKSKSGEIKIDKIQHFGGDLKLSATYNLSAVTSNSNSRAQKKSRTTTKATYKFECNVTDAKYNDTTVTYDFSGQLNSQIEYYFINPNSMASIFGQLVDSTTYDQIFPNRFGLGYGAYISTELPSDTSLIVKLASDGDYDFFTYESLISAIDNMAEIEVDLYQVVGHDYMHRIVWRNKITSETREMVNNQEYENIKSTGTEVKIATVDYGNFCNEGNLATRKQELAAFLGNISHETTGAGTEETSKTWGLYWREETAWQNGSKDLGYVDQYPNPLYPPSTGQSYHGRGPIQITHNVNYGQLSEFLYGDKQILLDNPGKLVPDKPEDATTAFMSAIWFWMTPQAPKPSCHDVMVGNWIPDAADKAANRDQSKFGMTVNIINGGLECGIANDSRVNDRIGFYKRYIELLGEPAESKCDCENMSYYQ